MDESYSRYHRQLVDDNSLSRLMTLKTRFVTEPNLWQENLPFQAILQCVFPSGHSLPRIQWKDCREGVHTEAKTMGFQTNTPKTATFLLSPTEESNRLSLHSRGATPLSRLLFIQIILLMLAGLFVNGLWIGDISKWFSILRDNSHCDISNTFYVTLQFESVESHLWVQVLSYRDYPTD